MDSLLHAADVSNPFKPFKVYEKWAFRVLNEFWNQVRGIPKTIRLIRAIKKEKQAWQ
jgi:hypothetical protein